MQFWLKTCFPITVQPRLSEPLWQAPKSKRSDEQKHSDNRESIFDVRLTTPTHISYSACHITDLLNNSMFHPILAENNGLPTLYMTFLNTMLGLLTCLHKLNGCTVLYCACEYRYRTRYLYFDLQFLLGSKFG